MTNVIISQNKFVYNKNYYNYNYYCIDTHKGYYFLNNRITSFYDVKEQLKYKNNKQINHELLHAKKSNNLSLMFLIGTPTLIIGIEGLSHTQSNLNYSILTLGISCSATSILTKIKEHLHYKRAIRIYNYE